MFETHIKLMGRNMVPNFETKLCNIMSGVSQVTRSHVAPGSLLLAMN